MCASKNCCFYSLIVFSVLGLVLFIFGAVILPTLVKSLAQQGALMNKDTEDLWAFIPGKSGVHIYQKFFFYDINNLENIVYTNDKAVANEKGPFIAEEITDLINVEYKDDNNTAGFNLFRYFEAPQEELKRQEDAKINMLNVISLGVWHQAKTISDGQVALKALYTIYKGLTNDLYYTAAVRAIQQGLNDTVFNQFKYFSRQKTDSLLTDPEYGLYRTNFKFMKAILNHPCLESYSVMDYFDLAFHEMQMLKDKLLQKANDLIFNNRNATILGLTQWLDLGVNQNQSIYTDFGPEYGYYLRSNNLPKSNLTLDQVLKLFTVNDFNSTAPLQDDSLSLLNKFNIDQIMNFLSYEDSVKYINENLQIGNLDEARNLRDYLAYIAGDMAFRYSKGGTRGMGAIADFLSQGFAQLFGQMGDDLFFGVFANKIFNGLFKDLKCEAFLDTYLFGDPVLKDLLSAKVENIKNAVCFGNANFKNNNNTIYINLSLEPNKNYTTENIENMRFWVENVLYKKQELQKVMNLTDFEWTLVTRENSLIVRKFAEYANQILKENNITYGNYKVFNRNKIAANQWATGIVTNNTNNTESVKDWNSASYKSKPEFANFCKKFYPDKCGEISSDEIFSIANEEKLFNSQFVTDLFIEYYNDRTTQNKFAQKYFIDYMRYFMFNEVLNIFTQKSAKELMWGFEDDLLKTVKNTNYYVGGDPTLDTTFSFLNNMTNLPDRENIWVFYTGKKDAKLTRTYKSVLGYNENKIILREKYFDGKKINKNSYRNPWKNYSEVKGTDAIAFPPGIDEDSKPEIYLDQLCRSGSFVFRKHLKHLNLDLLRFTIDKSLIQNSTLSPENDIFYSYKYNGFGNVSSVFKAPFYASKPYYYQCDNSNKEQPTINRAVSNHSKSDDKDDIDLFEESFVDIEPYSGAVIRAGQKILVSALLQKDELFEIDHDKFVPIYYVFRNGNFTQTSADVVFADLFSAFLFKKIFIIFGVFIFLFFLGLAVYLKIKRRKENKSPLLGEQLMN